MEIVLDNLLQIVGVKAIVVNALILKIFWGKKQNVAPH